MAHLRQSLRIKKAIKKNKNAKYTLKVTKYSYKKTTKNGTKKYSYVSKTIGKNGKYTYKYK